MSVSVTMPRLGESVTEGTVTRWLKKEGERVEADEPLLEVSTDKVDTEVPSPAAGVIQSIKVAEDETVDIGVELAVIGDGDGDGGDNAPAAKAEEPAAPEPAAAEKDAAEPAPEPDAAEPDAPAAETQSAEPAAPKPAPAPTQPAPVQQEAAPTEASAAAQPVAEADDDEVAETYVTPLVRKLASEHGVDLSAVHGTGVGGRIRKSDVLAAAGNDAAPAAPAPAATAPAPQAPAAQAPAPQAPAAQAPAAQAPAAQAPAASAPAPLRGRTEKLTRRRALIAGRMVESLQTSAQLTTVVEADVTRVARLRAAAKQDFEAREGVKLSFLPFFVQATIEALKAHANLNCSIDTEQGAVTYHDAVNMGIAVDTEQGLVVPVMHNAGDLNLGGIARKIADLAERTRTNKISPDELGGGTFTLTNTGSRGALFDTPIINQPQVGILGTGSVVKRAVVVSDSNIGETIAVRSMVYLALTYDHRIVDGADAARFLTTVKDRLEAASFEGELGLTN
ncbi:MAG: 2-oxo acid dehydrogenase subunit E2 [Jatrophihabitans sp.]